MSVKSIASELIIPYDKWPIAVNKLKIAFSNHSEVKEADTIHKILKIFNWRTRVDFNNKTISALDFNHPTEYPIESEKALLTISSLIEKDGYIQMYNSEQNYSWVFRFNGLFVVREKLTHIFIDPKRPQDLKQNLTYITKCLLDLKVSRTELHKMIDEIFLAEYFD